MKLTTLINVLILVAVTVGAIAVLPSGCRERTAEEKHDRAVRKMVRQVLKNLEFPRRSRIMFCTNLFKAGTTIRFRETESVVLEKSGYLIFIDEAPKYDWGHSAQMVFFEQTLLNEPKVLFRNTRPRKIVDKDKKEILQQKWILW